MKRAWAAIIAAAMLVMILAQPPSASDAQAVPCPSGIISSLVKYRITICAGSSAPTTSPTSTPTATPVPTSTPLDGATPQAFAMNASEAFPPTTYLAYPGTGIATGEYMADEVANEFGVNPQTCNKSQTMFSSSPLSSDLIAQDVLRMGIRHIRGGIETCYNETAQDAFYQLEYQSNVFDQIGGIGSFVPAPFLATVSTTFPQLVMIEGSNESDTSSGGNSNQIYGSTAVAGATLIKCGFSTGTSQTACSNDEFFPGAVYQIQDGANSEYIVLAAVQDQPLSNPGNTVRTTMRITSPLLFSHAAGTPIQRWNNVTNAVTSDFVPEHVAYYTYVNPQIRAAMPYAPNLELSLAHPHNATDFTNDLLGWAGVNVDFGNTHNYPTPANMPAEGTTGDWATGNSGSDAICTGKYSTLSDARCSSIQIAGPQRENIMDITTEYGRSCVANPAAYIPSGSSTSAIPPSVCVDYMVGDYMGMLARGVLEKMWFNLKDEEGCPTYYLCTAGLVADPVTTGGTGASFLKPFGIAYLALANWFTDPGCRFSIDGRKTTCSFTPTPVNGTWSDQTLPFNTMGGFQWSSGTIAVPFWEGAVEYSLSPSGSCATNATCTIAVTPQTETFTSPLIGPATSVHLVYLDNNATDPTPTPAPTTTPLADGSTPNFAEPICNVVGGALPPTTARFGCLVDGGALTKSGTGNNSVSVTSTREMQYVWIVPATAAPVTVTTAVPTYAPLPMPSAPLPPTPGPT